MRIAVDDSVAYGNVAEVEVSSDPPTVAFTPHPHGGPEALWFCFRVNCDPAPESLRLVLKHPDTALGLGGDGPVRPVARRLDADWERLDAGVVETLPDGRRQLVWQVDNTTAGLDVAFCYPYGPPEVQALVDDYPDAWSLDSIGVSQEGRSIQRLSNSPGESDGERRGVYFVARQHSAEVSASWMLDGLLRRMAERGDEAPLVWAVPLSNIDGVIQGDYGKDNFPYDLNRAWPPTLMRHETLVISRDMQRWKRRCRPLLGIDFHAPGGMESDGIYAFLPKPEEYPEHHNRTILWASLIQAALGKDYAAERFARCARYASRWETPNFTRGVCGSLGVDAFCLEVPYHMVGDRLMTRDEYREAGRRIADVVIERIRTIEE